MSSPQAAPRRGSLLLAFLLVYVIWGSTYLAIHYALDTLPPFLMAGLRFMLAGSLMYGWLRLRGVPHPPWAQWWRLALIGVFLFLGGNGFVVWGQQYISSGLAALLVATLPLWLIPLDWLWAGGPRPGALALCGIACGCLGTVILVDPVSLGGAAVYLPGAGMVLLASLLWAIGSIYAKKIDKPRSIFMSVACQMLGGGLSLCVLAAALGEFSQLQVTQISLPSLAGFFYLVICGSIVASSAYMWLLQNASAASVSTYAFVNPAIAVFLGWLFADETLDARILSGAGIILAGVVLVLRARR
ncbi:MAG: EamA family transporter [Pseudomonadales bacterium]|jgi:drug/metabolite transporter (DMT)-like permease|nr:EamA family transporter [Pseudomonadales bacterium]